VIKEEKSVMLRCCIPIVIYTKVVSKNRLLQNIYWMSRLKISAS